MSVESYAQSGHFSINWFASFYSGLNLGALTTHIEQNLGCPFLFDEPYCKLWECGFYSVKGYFQCHDRVILNTPKAFINWMEKIQIFNTTGKKLWGKKSRGTWGCSVHRGYSIFSGSEGPGLVAREVYHDMTAMHHQ